MLTLEDLLNLPADEWNRRRREGEEVESFRGKDLSYANLSGRDLHNVDFINATLYEAQMELTNLCYASLQQTEFTRANLRSANLAGAIASEATLIRACLEEAILRDANLLYANMGRADLRGADLTGACIRGVLLNGALLTGAIGLPNVQEILASIPRNEKGEYVLCKVFLYTPRGEWVTPFYDTPVDVTEGTIVETDYVDLSPTEDFTEGLHVATREWCKKIFGGPFAFDPESACVPFEVYTDWVFMPLIGDSPFRCYWYRIGPQLAETCADL